VIEDRVLEALLKPKAVAVIGAAREPWKVGHIILRNIVEGGFPGRVYPVNPRAEKILELKCYPTILDVPETPDIAVIAVPAKIVPQVVEQCGQKGVPLIVIISAGFRETGPEGAKLEREVVEIARRYGSRIIGPNCLGIMNLDVKLNATFASNAPPPGPISFISQSGAVITAVIDLARMYGVGFNKIFSLGNKADIDETDLLHVLARDPTTSMVLMYIESIDRGQEFIKTAREIIKDKLVVAIKAGVTERGARAVSSHTGSLAGSARVYEVAFQQSGIVQVRSLRELLSFIRLAGRYSRPSELDKPRLVIVTNAGGPGIVATDACEKAGIELASIGPDLIERLRQVLPPAAALHNPIDVLGDADPDRYCKVLDIVLKYPEINSVLVIATPQATTRPSELADKLVNIVNRFGKKIVLVAFLGGESFEEATRKLVINKVPVYSNIEDAVDSLSVLDRWFKLRAKVLEYISEKITLIEIDVKAIREIIERAKSDGRRVLTLDEALELASRIGIDVPPGGLARTEDEAVHIAEKVGYPVVLRIVSPDILHKSDIGCVKLNINSPEEVRAAFRDIMEKVRIFAPHARIVGVHVSKMIKGRYEAIIGFTRDPQFGPVIMFGMGGIYVELFRDVSMRIAPFTRLEALDMIYETKIGKIMMGYRGSRPVNIDMIVNTILKVMSLAVCIEDIVEMDINPLLVTDNAVFAIDVKVVVR